MPVKKVDTIWMNGKLIKWDDAKIHILSHVIHYGSGWFEGIRCYDTKKGSAIFRLDAHIRRLYDSAKIYRSDIPYSKAELETAIKETWEESGLKAEIIDYIGDFPRSKSITRYYRARRTGGSPSEFGWETMAVKLISKKALKDFFNFESDIEIAKRSK